MISTLHRHMLLLKFSVVESTIFFVGNDVATARLVFGGDEGNDIVPP